MWVRLDDKLHSNPKVLEAGDEPIGLYCRALSYCGDHLTDGVVPAYWVVRNTTNETVARLIELDFWEEIRKGDHRYINRDNGDRVDIVAGADGYFIRDFLQINPSRVEVEQQRSSRAVAGRKGALARWGKNASRTPDMQGEHGNSHSEGITDRTASAYPPDPTLDHNPTLEGLSEKSSKGLSAGTNRPTPPQPKLLWTCRHPDCPTINGNPAYTFNRQADLQTHLDLIHQTEGHELTALVEQGRPERSE